MKAWTPKRRAGKWRDFLTVDEMDQVRDAEARSRTAKAALSLATGILNPIRQRASQRALAAERSAGS